MSQQEEDLRFERKAYVDRISRRSLISLVLQHPALFSRIHKERTVNSLYFDTPEFSDAFEKIDGLKSRRKVRIRWYGDVFGEVRKPVLEIKNKENGLGWKERHKLRPFLIEDRGDIPIDPEFEETEGATRSKTFMTNRIPSSLVSYRRMYFQTADNRFRLTVDDQLRFFVPLRDSRGWARVPDTLRGTIIELKYSKNDDSDARRVTAWYPFRWGTFSKYTQGLESGGIF